MKGLVKVVMGKLNRLPIITLSIILLNIIVAIVTFRNPEYSLLVYGLIPERYEIGRLLSANFLHASPFHLTINMFLLYVFGKETERAMGRMEFALFYLGACFASSLTYVLVVTTTFTPFYASRVIIGASGAVAGVMGFYAVRFHRRKFKLDGLEISALLLIMGWLILQVALGILGMYQEKLLGINLRNIAYWSHLGGFAYGIAIALAANMAFHGEREYLLDEARRHDREGGVLEAIQNYETLLRYAPDDPVAHAELGRLWAILEEEEESQRYYQVAIQLYIALGKEDKALVIADEMKRFWPDAPLSSATRFRFATYLEEIGQTKMALKAFRRVVEYCPDSVEAQMSLLKIGHMQLNSLHDPSSAINTLKTFMQRYPNSEWRKFAENSLEDAQSRVGRNGRRSAT